MQCSHFSVLSPLFLIPYFFLSSAVNVFVFLFVICSLTYLYLFPTILSIFFILPLFAPFACLFSFVGVSLWYFFFQIFVYVCHFIHCPFFRLCSTATIATVVQTVLKMYGLFSTSGKCKASTLIQATAASFCVLSNL